MGFHPSYGVDLWAWVLPPILWTKRDAKNTKEVTTSKHTTDVTSIRFRGEESERRLKKALPRLEKLHAEEMRLRAGLEQDSEFGNARFIGATVLVLWGFLPLKNTKKGTLKKKDRRAGDMCGAATPPRIYP